MARKRLMNHGFDSQDMDIEVRAWELQLFYYSAYKK